MLAPLPSDIVARLRSDSTAALAASLILAGSFPDIVSWALRAFGKSGEPKANVPAHGDSKNRHAPRRLSAAKSDQALLAVMRANPGSSLADLIRLGRRPRTSTVLSLKRLEEAGLVEHPSKGQYKGGRPSPAETGTDRPTERQACRAPYGRWSSAGRDDDGVRKARNRTPVSRDAPYLHVALIPHKLVSYDGAHPAAAAPIGQDDPELPSRLVLWTGGMHRNAVIGGTLPLRH